MSTTPGTDEQRFAGYDVLDQSATWDSLTRGVVLARLLPPAPLTFFTAVQEPTSPRPAVDRLLAQDDEPRVPVVEQLTSASWKGAATAIAMRRCPRTGKPGRDRSMALMPTLERALGVPFRPQVR